MFDPRPEIRTASRSGCERSLLDEDTTPAFADFADHLRGLASRLQQTDGRFGLGRRYDGDHADTAVEGAIHLRLLDTPLPLEPVERRIPVPAASAERDLQTFGQYARYVVCEPAAGDVREPVNRY